MRFLMLSLICVFALTALILIGPVVLVSGFFEKGEKA